jgi:Chaperonin 10 Kd subunit
MDIRPLHDRLIVRRIEEGEQQVGGIIIPDTAKEKPQRGTVIAAGNGKGERRRRHRTGRRRGPDAGAHGGRGVLRSGRQAIASCCRWSSQPTSAGQQEGSDKLVEHGGRVYRTSGGE